MPETMPKTCEHEEVFTSHKEDKDLDKCKDKKKHALGNASRIAGFIFPKSGTGKTLGKK